MKAADKTLRRELGPGRLLVSLGLLVLVVISALAVVDSTHRARERFNHLQEMQRQEWALDEEWERLLLEQSTWAAHERVNQIAETKLDMVTPDPRRSTLFLPHRRRRGVVDEQGQFKYHCIAALASARGDSAARTASPAVVLAPA